MKWYEITGAGLRTRGDVKFVWIQNDRSAELKVVIEPKSWRAAPVPSYAGDRERGTDGAWQLKLQCIAIIFKSWLVSLLPKA